MGKDSHFFGEPSTSGHSTLYLSVSDSAQNVQYLVFFLMELLLGFRASTRVCPVLSVVPCVL